jgi:cytoskeleton protein RodZ
MSETQAAGLGAELRAARQAQGWELPQLAASLRIRQSYLEAIEAGRIAELPGATYALGFVRTYAAALGLSGEDVAKRFRAETTMVPGQTALRFPAPVPQRGVPAGALMLLGVLILAGAYGGWYWFTEHRTTPVEVVPPIPDRMVAETQKPQPSPQVASLLPATSPPASTQIPAHQPPPILTPPGTAQTQAPPAQTASPQAHVEPPLAPPAPPPPPVPATAGITIRATADAWLTVKQPGGPPLLNKLMHAGESWAVPPDKTGLTLTTGNAGGTQIDVDGTPIPVSLGGSGAVRRDLPLQADLLKSGKLPPAPRRAHPVPAEE